MARRMRSAIYITLRIVPSITIPAGRDNRDATMTFTPVNNTDEDDTRAFTVNAMLGKASRSAAQES